MIFAHQALLSTGWAQDVRLTLIGGCIQKIETDAHAQAGDICVDTLLPALANLHSHTFQRAMAGMTEVRKSGRDSFWTWRDLMYRFMDHLTPDQLEAIAALVFMEMQEAGYASVGEFHYVHHQRGGMRYDALAELSLRVMSAASQSGIGLTHLPVLYTYGGAGQVPLEEGQRRFGNDIEQYNA
ncbi:MAG: amidohydrolase family protein, partial [Pseudoruegeria sp.]